MYLIPLLSRPMNPDLRVMNTFMVRQLFFELFSENRFTLNGKHLLSFSFRVDPIQKGLCVQYSKQEVTEVVSLVEMIENVSV